MIKALLVGEAWGEREHKFKHALVGPSGAELARMLGEVNLAPAPRNKYPSEGDMIMHWENLRHKFGIEIANVFNMHPPYNGLMHFFNPGSDSSLLSDRSLPPLRIEGKQVYVKQEFRAEVEKLWTLIDRLKPNLVICMGNTACWAVLRQVNISAIRGTVQQSSFLNVKVLPTYHPAAILRDWSLRPITLADLKKAQREYQFPEIKRVERWITCHDHINNVRLTLDEINEWFNTSAQGYAVDIETGYALFERKELNRMTPQMRRTLSTQISMVGFANTPNRALVIPFMDRNCPNLSYWPDANQETRAWKLMYERGLRSTVPKIFQNGMFDISHFLAHGLVPQHCEDDTMLRHHALYPELLKSLGFLGSIYSNERSWKQDYKASTSLKRDE